MKHPRDQLSRYVDGELDDAEAEAVAAHVADCAACGEALQDMLQLVALEAAVRCADAAATDASDAPSPSAKRGAGHDVAATAPRLAPKLEAVAPLARPGRSRSDWRRRSTWAVTAAAAAIFGIWLLRRVTPDGPDAQPVVLIAAQVRTIEGRISYAAADQHRPYAVLRAPGAAGSSDALSLETLAKLERRNDLHGIAAAFVIAGDPARAASYLDRATVDADVSADRGLLQVLAGHPAEALIILDEVLAARPRHPQALWNRALALRDLGLPAAAAEAFEAVAALNEPGWAAEAQVRARELSEPLRERRAAFKRLILTDGPHLATAPSVITPEVARRFPGMARLLFYDGVRGAASAETVRALAPLAHTLDEAYGGTTLSAYVARIAGADFTARAPLARRYSAIVAGDKLDPAATRAFLAALRAAHADDILLGAIVRTAPRGEAPAELLSELRRLCEATGDPWFPLLAVEREVSARLARNDRAAAEALALPALATCETSRLDYRCAALELMLGDSYVHMVRVPEARRLLADAAVRAQRGAEWNQEKISLELLSLLALIADDVDGSTLAVARAYRRELVLREPERCDIEVRGNNLVALLLVSRGDFAAARTELARASTVLARCPTFVPDSMDLFVAANVLRDPAAGTAEDVARLRAQIARARTEVMAGEQVMLDHIEGRLLLDRDRVTGLALLEHAIAGADALDAGDIDGRKARSYAHSLLVLDAGRSGEWDRVWELLGRAARTTAAPRCSLGVSVEDDTSVVVVRDAGGTSQGRFEAGRSGSAIDAPQLTPPPLRAALGGCPEVEVLARPPVQGLPQLLPDDVAWSYRLDGDRSRTTPGQAGPAPAHTTRLVIANTEPPAALGFARLLPWRSAEPPDVRLDGPSATPSRALAELADATFVEIHSHGVLDASGADASFLMLSPESDGRYALTAAAIRRQPLRGHPIVILAACHAARTASYRHEAWSLPAAFIAAGARAVIASTEVIDDKDAGTFFDDMRARIAQHASPAVALRDARVAWLRSHAGASWVHSLMVFQ